MQPNNDITDVVDNNMKHRIGISWWRVMMVMLTPFLNWNGVIAIWFSLLTSLMQGW